MLNFEVPDELEKMLELALEKGDGLLSKVKEHADSIHPYRDGRSSERVLDAIDDLLNRGTGHLKAEPLNLVRRIKMRKNSIIIDGSLRVIKRCFYLSVEIEHQKTFLQSSQYS